MPEPIDEQQLKAIVNSEIRSAMGELTGDLANERAEALDYYHGEATGKLYQPNADRSRIVITTLRDTVEWMLPQLMRLFAQADKVVEFEAVGDEDEEAAEQETQAINHIFWRQNEGFLILYEWFKDALLQKNGTVKYWIDESEERDREEYDGLTDMALAQMSEDPELEVLEHEASEALSIDGQRLHHVVFERTSTKKKINVEVIPPEEFMISDDARSLDVQTKRPRMVGHHSDKTAHELREMGFSEEAVEEMMKSDDESERYDEEWVARYNISDEQQILTGGTDYGHESQRKTRLYELYMDLDKNGDGYAELLRIYYAGDYIEVEETDHVPFACLTPYINPHKHFGLSEYDMVHDLQELATQIFRNVLDNMYQTNNTRPIANENVDLDSLLVSRPGAPIYTETTGPVANDIGSFAPPPMWKEGLQLLEYVDTIRKDRTGVADETLGLDAQQLANVNTGVLMEAIEAARGKIELVARIFAETGIKWLFRGIHELARKSYDQELRYELAGKYVEVNPQEWRKRTNLTVNVGTASGSQQRELSALQQIGQIQERMVGAGGVGMTVLPVHIYRAAKDYAEALGQKDGDQYFFNPELLKHPEIQQYVAAQMPQQGPDPQAQLLALNAQIEQGKMQTQQEKNQLEFQFKADELGLRREEMTLKQHLEAMKTQMEAIKADAQNQTQLERVRSEAQIKTVANMINELKIQLGANQQMQELAMKQYQTDVQSATQIEVKAMDVTDSVLERAERQAQEMRQRADDMRKQFEENQGKARQLESESVAKAQAQEKQIQQAGSQIASLMDRLSQLTEEMSRPRVIKRDESGRPVAVGDKAISYNSDGTIAQIG